MLPSLRDLDLEQLERLAAKLGEKRFRGRQIAAWLFKKGVADFGRMTDLPSSLVEKLQRDYSANSLALVSKHVSSLDRSVKYLFQTEDHHLLESVLIFQGSRRTVCLSTQIGCKMGCVFCASGKAGFVRHLSAGEILDQVAWILGDQNRLPTNLVYMGMGEPLENYEPVVKSIRAANASWGFGIGQRRITVSTVGWIPGIRKLAEEDLAQIKLSISLHSPDNGRRSRLIPVNRKYGIPQLIKALKEVRGKFKREITMEYILIDGATDREEDAKKLIEIARSLRSKINLIPYNAIQVSGLTRPSVERIRSFQKRLEGAGVRATVRYSAGQDIEAACGQLRLRKENGVSR